MTVAEPVLSICIVNWRTRDYLRRCLRSILSSPLDFQYEVLVADNASGDGSEEMVRDEFPQVQLSANQTNLGYAAANNQLLAKAQGEFALLLNPDVQVIGNAIAVLLNFLRENKRAGACAPQLRNPDGTVQMSVRSFPTPDVLWWEALRLSRFFPRSRTFGKYRMTWWSHLDQVQVAQPMGSALMLRMASLQKTGKLDESLPLYFNDVDLCYRLRRDGWEIWYVPQAQMTHYLGASTRQVRKQAIKESHAALVRFYEKHYRTRYPAFTYKATLALVRLAARARLAVGG